MSRSGDCRQSRLQVVSTGLMFLLSGLAVLGGSRGWYSVRDAWRWWPVVFLFPAVQKLTAPPPERNVFAGVAWLTAGAVIILANLDVIDLRFSHVLATALVATGLRMLWIATRETGAR